MIFFKKKWPFPLHKRTQWVGADPAAIYNLFFILKAVL